MGNSFNFYWASFPRNSEFGKVCILYCTSQKGDGEKDILIHKALISQSSLPTSLPAGLYFSPPTSWVLKFKLAQLCWGTGFTLIFIECLLCARHYSKSVMDVRSLNLQMILWGKHCLFPHITDEDSEIESSCHLAKVTWLVGGDWNSSSETGSRTHAPDH